jgi:transcription antitermination factor NusG
MSALRDPLWYAIQARSNFENLICRKLDLRGIETYCPMIRTENQWADRKKFVEFPLFKGYVFAHFLDTSETRLRILKAQGVVRILGKAGTIEPISQIEIDSIRKTLSSGRPWAPHPYLLEGSKVRVRRGALKNVEGILVKIKNDVRLVLSINMFSRSIATEVDMKDIELLAPPQVECGSSRMERSNCSCIQV